jgi:uncharacterized protein (TIGR02118 family)
MIRVAVLYPYTPQATFDYTYYINKHMKLVHDKLHKSGLKKIEVDKAIDKKSYGTDVPYITIGYLFFDSLDNLKKSSAIMAELQQDIPNFTNVQPQVQVCEIIM